MKNKHIIHGDKIEILLERKKDGLKLSTFVSSKHLEKLRSFNCTWYPHWDKSANAFYVRSGIEKNNKRITIILHRWITDAEKGYVVDHINHDTLDNTDENLRVVDRFINGMNRRGANKNNKTSGMRNISWNKKCKMGLVRFDIRGNPKIIGRYKDIEDAKQAAFAAQQAILAEKVG